MSNSSITVGLIASAIVILLLGVSGPAIRDWYRSSRDKMRAALARRRQKR